MTRVSHAFAPRTRLECVEDCPLRTYESVWAIIPARNECASLPLVLNDLPTLGRVIVVDNGSTDRTAAVARRWGADVVNESRRGYGSACLAGLAFVEHCVRVEGRAPRVIVFLDADYSDHPNELPKLVEPVLEGRFEMVLGSRLMGTREAGAMPPQSVWGNRFACWLIRIIWGTHYTDLGPFRAIDYRALRLLRMSDTNFGWTIEMQIKALLAGFRVMETPVSYRRRIGRSKISGTVMGTIKAGGKILLTIARYWWRTKGNKKPFGTPD